MSDLTDRDRALAAAAAWAVELHRVVDELTRPVVEANAARLHCRSGCHACCTDELTVFPVEAAVIRENYPQLLETGTPAPEASGCAFLDGAGACRIYAHRPYVCRTQGLPLRWAEEDEDGAPVEARDICPLNVEGAPPLEDLPPESCWTLGPVEERLAARQRSLGEAGADLPRVALRDLFARGARRRLPTAD